MQKSKPQLGSTSIGNPRFFAGIIIGLCYAVIVSLLIQLLFKTSSITYAIKDGYWFHYWNTELSIFNSFLFGLTSASLGFCFTTYIWMSKVFSSDRKTNFHRRLTQTNSQFVFWLILFALMSFYQIYFGFNFDGFTLNLNRKYGALLYLFPIFIFQYNWLLLKKVYRIRTLWLFSLLGFISLGVILGGLVF